MRRFSDVVLRCVLWLRFFKLLSAFAFVAGTIGALVPGVDHAMRKRFVFAIAAPGFGATWALGFILVSVSGHSVMAPWVLLSLVSSMVVLQVLLYLAGREGRGGIKSRGIALFCLIATIALMVWRPA